MRLHPIGLAKRQLFKQVWTCAKQGGAGTVGHLAAIKSFHKAAWECFAARKVDPPQQRTEYVYYIRQGDARTPLTTGRQQRPEPVDARTKKAIFSIERDCEFCFQELHRAIDHWRDGTAVKIRALDTLAKWRKDYDSRWAVWLARGKKKLPPTLKALKEFADAHGQVHFVAGSEKYFATAKEAQRYMASLDSNLDATHAEEWHRSETNQRLMDLFDRAQDNPELWEELERALKQVESEDAAEKEDDENED